MGAAADLTKPIDGAAAIVVFSVSLIAGKAGAPIGAIPTTFTVLLTTPALTSGWVTPTDVQLYVHISRGSKTSSALVSPDNRVIALAQLSSEITRFEMLTLPVLSTTN